jgi:hypothetical protein
VATQSIPLGEIVGDVGGIAGIPILVVAAFWFTGKRLYRRSIVTSKSPTRLAYSPVRIGSNLFDHLPQLFPSAHVACIDEFLTYRQTTELLGECPVTEDRFVLSGDWLKVSGIETTLNRATIRGARQTPGMRCSLLNVSGNAPVTVFHSAPRENVPTWSRHFVGGNVFFLAF